MNIDDLLDEMGVGQTLEERYPNASPAAMGWLRIAAICRAALEVR